MFGYLLTVCFAITLLNYSKGSNISDRRLCYDPQCTVILSRAKTLLKYATNLGEGLSFPPGAEVNIYSKSAGSKPELWGAEFQGKRGYIPKGMVKEVHVFHPDSTLQYDVPTVMPDEKDGKEAGAEKQEGSTDTMQEKPDVKVIENPANINSESSVKKAFDVVDGTTFYADTLGLATPTVNPLDSSSIEMGVVPIESTTSFTATTSDMSTARMAQSEMAPISPTTMMEKPEEHESNTEAMLKFTDEEGGMVEFVSGGEEELPSKRSGQETKDEKGESETFVADDRQVHEATESRRESKTEFAEMSGDSLLNDTQETIDDEDDEDEIDEEEEGEDDEDDEDDEEDIEPVGNDENVENDLGDSIELDSDVRSTGNYLSEMVKETKSEMITPRNESDLDVVVSTDPVALSSSKETTSDISAGGAVSEKVGNSDTVTEVTSEINVSPQTVSNFNETFSLQDVAPSAKSFDDVGMDNSHNKHKSITEDTENNIKFEAVPDDSVLYNVDQQADSPAVNMENTKDVIDGSESVFMANDGHDRNNEIKIQNDSGEVMVGSYLKSQEDQEVVPMVTAEATEKEIPESPIVGDQSIQLDLDSVTPEITSENSVTAAPTTTLGDHNSEPSLPTEPSNIVSDEFASYSGHSDFKPLESMGMEEVDISKLQPQQTLESDKNMELDASSDVKESESQQDDVAIESPNASNTENLQPVSEDSSSGIFSILFDSLGSGYGFVSSMIFGSGDGRIEVMEGQDGSSQGVSHIAASKYSDSEHNPYQQSPSEDVQNIAAGGDSVFGRSSNSDCEGSSETNCEPPSTLSSNDMSSSDTRDPYSKVGPESSSWMGLPSFSFGNDSSGMFNFNVPSYGAVIYSIITGVIVLCFFLGHYFIEGNRRDVVLLAKINSLEKELTVSSKECLILKEKLKQFEIKSSDFDDSAEVINSMQSELEKVQNEKAQLEKELEATTEAGLEMEHMVSQFLSSQHDSKSLMESIEQLQMQANKQQAKISSLENSLVAKTQENEKLAQELGVTESKVQELEEDLKQVSENLLQRDEEHSKRCTELKELSESQHNKYLEDVKNKTIETEMALTRCKSLETTLTELKEMLAVKENEICVLQECLQQLKLSNGDDPDQAESQLKDILNFGKIKADLTSVTKERDNLKEKLQGEEDARRLLEDHVKVIREEVEKLRKCHEAAEREKVEAQTRLEVLSSYFKEKETQLQKELGNKEALWVQKHTDASTIMQRMKSLEEEVENYKKEENVSKPNVSDSMSLKEATEITTTHPLKECKEDDFSKPDVFNGSTPVKMEKETVGETSEKKGSQNETLKKEILDQERGYKTQLATFEKKSHENWVAARQAERKLEESKQEASQLRNRLTMADKTNPTSTSQNGDDPKPNLSMIDSNGELSASPLHLGLASNSSVDMLLSDPHPHYLDPNSSPPHVGGGSRLPPPPLLPPPFPPMPLPPRSPYHHPLSPPLPFMPLPPPDANLYPSSVDGHRPPPLGRMSSPPPVPSPSQSPHLPPNDSRGGEFPSPYRDRGGGGRSSSPSRLYMSPDDRGLGEEWRMGRYCTPPPHPNHPSDFPIPPYPPRPHWEDEPPHPTSSFRPLPTSSQRTDSHRELKGRKKFSKIRRFWSTLECAPSESHTQTK